MPLCWKFNLEVRTVHYIPTTLVPLPAPLHTSNTLSHFHAFPIAQPSSLFRNLVSRFIFYLALLLPLLNHSVYLHFVMGRSISFRRSKTDDATADRKVAVRNLLEKTTLEALRNQEYKDVNGNVIS